MHDIEVVSIKSDSISIINTTIPSLPKGLNSLRGTTLPDHDLLVSGGHLIEGNEDYLRSDEYLRFSQDSKQWKKVGTMKMARLDHSSVLMNGGLYSVGGKASSWNGTSHHEVLNLDGWIGWNFLRVEEKKKLPIALSGHTANKLDENKYMVIGGLDRNVSKQIQIIKIDE